MFRSKQQGDTITLWDDLNGIGLRFAAGQPLQVYTAAIIVNDLDRLATDEGQAEVNRIADKLKQEAAKAYPLEFAPLQ